MLLFLFKIIVVPCFIIIILVNFDINIYIFLSKIYYIEPNRFVISSLANSSLSFKHIPTDSKRRAQKKRSLLPADADAGDFYPNCRPPPAPPAIILESQILVPLRRLRHGWFLRCGSIFMYI